MQHERAVIPHIHTFGRKRLLVAHCANGYPIDVELLESFASGFRYEGRSRISVVGAGSEKARRRIGERCPHASGRAVTYLMRSIRRWECQALRLATTI